jgi:hypothetical protein
MLRETLTADSAHVILDVGPGGGIEFMTRSATGEATSFVAGAGAAFPVWLRLTRVGNTVTGTYSTTGTSWTTVGSVEVSWGPSGHAGLVVTSHDATVLAQARFEQIALAVTPPADDDVVIYAADAQPSEVHGAWTSACCDAASPLGTRLTTTDMERAVLDAALAVPEHYVDFTFDARAVTTYTLWLRLRAAANSKWNDSVWVQFSDAMVDGSPAYGVNTTSGLLVNLAQDSSASGMNGWGWVNGAYWLSQPASMIFQTDGPHVIRVQLREDGVSLDQILLSAGRFRVEPPGPRSNDSTIVPR